jgi:hypothetical protein
MRHWRRFRAENTCITQVAKDSGLSHFVALSVADLQEKLALPKVTQRLKSVKEKIKKKIGRAEQK